MPRTGRDPQGRTRVRQGLPERRGNPHEPAPRLCRGGRVRQVAETPARLRGFGSPTVLVEGMDVAGAQPVEGLPSCRSTSDAASPRSS
jgi:hypothetical protein